MLTVLPAVYSLRHTGLLPFALPSGWQLATHQAEVYAALQEPEVDVVFDTAMTGDGKTLAAHLPVLQQALAGQPVFVYPTNELIRDQERQAQELQELFGYQGRYKPEILDGQAITNLANEQSLHRYEAVEDLLYGFKLLLTNPDLFTLVNNFAYRLPHQNAPSLALKFNNTFRYVVFDEFHTYDAAQVTAVLDAIVFASSAQGEQHRAKYLFLSATPSEAFIQRLSQAGLRCREVGGQYHHGADPGPAYRPILAEVSLDVQRCEVADGGIQGWFNREIEQVKAFYAAEPGSKGAVICNSVLSAKRLTTWLREVLPEVTVVENTGLTGAAERRAAFDALASDRNTLLVATSTVDVGVDFRLNYLVFEALDAGAFIQRLGRLGRHSGFAFYHAVALLPGFLVERLDRWLADRAQLDTPLNRAELFQALREQVYPDRQQFSAFTTRWGGVRAAERYLRLRKGFNTDAGLLARYEALAQQVYHLNRGHFGHLKALTDPAARQQAVLDELHAFRGAGLLDAWINDPASGVVTSMNVLRLLSGTACTPLTEAQARATSERLGVRFMVNPLGLYFRIDAYEDERLSVDLTFTGRILDQPLNIATQRQGFQLQAQHVHATLVNRALRSQKLCTCALDSNKFSTAAQTRTWLKLPPLFDLHAVRDQTGASHILSFGPDALLLDSIQYWEKVNDAFIV